MLQPGRKKSSSGRKGGRGQGGRKKGKGMSVFLSRVVAFQLVERGDSWAIAPYRRKRIGDR